MKRPTFSAIFVLSLLLSQQAKSANAEQSKVPLTAAEKTQCRVQLTEFNQSAQNYNAELDALKVLETEIKDLSAELDKEQVAVDRRDRAAMDALNAKIGKNNELVERHERMISSIKAMSDENKQLRAQFSDACENRPLSLPAPPDSQPRNTACNSTAGKKDVENRIEATFAEIRADEKQRQAEVDRVAAAQAKAQSWGAEKRSKIWLQILGSPKFMAFEREKQPYVKELMRIVGSKPKNEQEECRLVQRIAAMLPAIKAINARQYAFMADQIRVAN